MSDSPDSTKGSGSHHTRGMKSNRGHLALVEEVFDDGLMPWDEVTGSRVKGEDGLTNKQRAFVRAMLGGAPSATSAYKEAYDAERMSPKSIHNEAGRLMSHPVIARRLAVGFAEQEERALYSEVSRSRFVIERLTFEALHAPADASRVAALVALGRSCGLFTSKVQVDEPDRRSAAEIGEALEAKLKGLLADRPTCG